MPNSGNGIDEKTFKLLDALFLSAARVGVHPGRLATQYWQIEQSATNPSLMGFSGWPRSFCRDLTPHMIMAATSAGLFAPRQVRTPIRFGSTRVMRDIARNRIPAEEQKRVFVPSQRLRIIIQQEAIRRDQEKKAAHANQSHPATPITIFGAPVAEDDHLDSSFDPGLSP